MIKKFTLNGLNCPHCASKIEHAVGDLDGVTSSTVNLVNQTLTVELNPNRSITADVVRIVHSYEPDVTVEEFSKTDTPTHNRTKFNAIRIIVGAVIFSAGFVLNTTLKSSVIPSLILFITAYTVMGIDVLCNAIRNIIRGRVFDENFLMALSTAGAFIIGEYPEAAAVMLFYQIGEFFQTIAVNRSRKSISTLMDIRPDYANLKTENGHKTVAPESVKVGDLILVMPGERVPLDGIICDGSSTTDTRALTGESAPAYVSVGDTVLSGTVNIDGVITLEVTKSFGNSTASKIIDLVENASNKKAPTENFISVFARYYTPIVVALAVLLAILPPLFGFGTFTDWVYRSFSFLVISCPCAVVISIPLTYMSGIGAASRHGILIKGGNYIDVLAKTSEIIFDKTGTLTKGNFKVIQILPVDDTTEIDLLELATAGELYSPHPIADAIKSVYDGTISQADLTEYKEIPGHGINVLYKNTPLLVGNRRLMEQNGIIVDSSTFPGTVVHVAYDNKYKGSIIICDEIKTDARSTIAQLKKCGITKTAMLTGDSEKIAKDVSDAVGIDVFYSRLLPQDKVEILCKLTSDKTTDGKIAYVGDGINDAPVLACADVGIAMGGLGSDAAIEAADIVLMKDELDKIPKAIKIARKTSRIAKENIIFTLSVKGIFLILAAFGIAGMWEAVFGDVGVMVLAVLNAIRMLKTK